MLIQYDDARGRTLGAPLDPLLITPSLIMPPMPESPPSTPITPRQPLIGAPAAACIWAILLLWALWRVLLAARITPQGTMEVALGSRILPWLSLMCLILATSADVAREPLGGTENLRRRRIHTLLIIFLAVSSLLTILSLVCQQFGTFSPLTGGIAFAGEALAALVALVLSARQVRTLLAALQGGGAITLLDLWRFAAAQWGLLMVSALLYMRLTVSPGELAGNAAILRLQFLLPAAGVLPNAMMVAGIAWWDLLIRPTQQRMAAPRIRAWLIAMLAINLAGLLLVLRPLWLGIPGSALGAIAITAYLLGFPASTWRNFGGIPILIAWIFLAAALAATGIERVASLTGSDLLAVTFSGAAARHIWSVGAPTLWLLGLCSTAARIKQLSRATSKFIMLIGASNLAGACATAGVFLVASVQTAQPQTTTLHPLIVGASLELLAVFAAGIMLLRLKLNTAEMPASMPQTQETPHA